MKNNNKTQLSKINEEKAITYAFEWADKNLSHFKGSSFFARREMVKDFALDFFSEITNKNITKKAKYETQQK